MIHLPKLFFLSPASRSTVATFWIAPSLRPPESGRSPTVSPCPIRDFPPPDGGYERSLAPVLCTALFVCRQPLVNPGFIEGSAPSAGRFPRSLLVRLSGRLPRCRHRPHGRVGFVRSFSVTDCQRTTSANPHGLFRHPWDGRRTVPRVEGCSRKTARRPAAKRRIKDEDTPLPSRAGPSDGERIDWTRPRIRLIRAEPFRLSGGMPTSSWACPLGRRTCPRRRGYVFSASSACFSRFFCVAAAVSAAPKTIQTGAAETAAATQKRLTTNGGTLNRYRRGHPNPTTQVCALGATGSALGTRVCGLRGRSARVPKAEPVAPDSPTTERPGIRNPRLSARCPDKKPPIRTQARSRRHEDCCGRRRGSGRCSSAVGTTAAVSDLAATRAAGGIGVARSQHAQESGTAAHPGCPSRTSHAGHGARPLETGVLKCARFLGISHAHRFEISPKAQTRPENSGSDPSIRGT